MILGNDLAGRAGWAGALPPRTPVVVSRQLASLEQQESDLGFTDWLTLPNYFICLSYKHNVSKATGSC